MWRTISPPRAGACRMRPCAGAWNNSSMASEDRADESDRRSLVARLIDVRPHERAALAWAMLYIFAVLSAYYVIRPIRDEMGAHSGVSNLPWLFTATLLAMLAVTPLFGALVKRLPRR